MHRSVSRCPRQVAFLICLLAVLFLAWPAIGSLKPTTEFTILHTNDLHGHLFPFDYDSLGKVETDVGGAARRAALVRKLKKEAGHPVLVMDAGDAFTRGPLADLEGVPDFDVMNAVPYDIMVLGNNEFKGAGGLRGQKIMFERIKQARFPVICANVFDRSTGKTIVPRYKILDAGGLKVGVFGLTPPRVADYEQAQGLEIRDPVEVAKAIVPELERQCDFVVALSHAGYHLDLIIASLVPGIDVIIGGDTHTWLFEPTFVSHDAGTGPEWWVRGTIVCQAGEWGKCLGRLDLSLRRTDSGRYRVERYAGRLVEVDSSIAPAPDVERIVAKYAAPYGKEIGRLGAAVPKAEAAAWVAERMRVAAGAQAGVEPKGSVENGLKAGSVTELDIRKMFPFVNGVLKLQVTGRQLASFIASTDSGLAGVRFVDETLYVGENKAEDDATYTLAVEDFYAGALPALAGAKAENLGKTTRDIVREYIASSPGGG